MNRRDVRPLLLAGLAAALAVAPGLALAQDCRVHGKSVGSSMVMDAIDAARFEATAFAYRLIERMGYDKAPAFLIEKIKIDGQWMDGPILGNLYGGWDDEGLPFGVEPLGDDPPTLFQAVLAHMETRMDDSGAWKTIPPIEVEDAASAPCKEIILTGNDIDVEQFPWLR